MTDFEQPIGKIQPTDPKCIWEEHEIPNEEDFEDSRARPKFQILYKQQIMTEDSNGTGYYAIMNPISKNIHLQQLNLNFRIRSYDSLWQNYFKNC